MIRSVVERVERIDEEIAERNDLKSGIFQEAKGNGLDPKIIKRVIAARRKDPEKRTEEDELFDLYFCAAESGKPLTTTANYGTPAHLHA